METFGTLSKDVVSRFSVENRASDYNILYQLQKSRNILKIY